LYLRKIAFLFDATLFEDVPSNVWQAFKGEALPRRKTRIRAKQPPQSNDRREDLRLEQH
jgi:hypothetical protein